MIFQYLTTSFNICMFWGRLGSNVSCFSVIFRWALKATQTPTGSWRAFGDWPGEKKCKTENFEKYKIEKHMRSVIMSIKSKSKSPVPFFVKYLFLSKTEVWNPPVNYRGFWQKAPPPPLWNNFTKNDGFLKKFTEIWYSLSLSKHFNSYFLFWI